MALKMYAEEAPDSNHWDHHWAEEDFDTQEAIIPGSLVASLVEKYLPSSGLVLEAGCGIGQWVRYLRQQGAEAIGIDFSVAALRKGKMREFGLPVLVADVTHMPFGDRTFDLCLSLGVVEHFEEGPIAALQEAQRILQAGGVLVCTVPFFNPIRVWKKRFLSGYQNRAAEGTYFYQWAFRLSEISTYLRQAGFVIEQAFPWDASKGIADEVPGLKRLRKSLSGPPGSICRQRGVAHAILAQLDAAPISCASTRQHDPPLPEPLPAQTQSEQPLPTSHQQQEYHRSSDRIHGTCYCR